MNSRGVVAVLAMVAMITGVSCGMSLPDRSASIGLEGRLNCPYISNRGGSAFLQLAVVASEGHRYQRKPVNLCVVLDRSGSMREEGKIVNAKAALQALMDQLTEGDVFSLVIYDDVVDVLRPASRVGTRRELRELLGRIQPRGWTNLGGGMMEGFRQAERYAGGEFVNRVILLSDGLANQGITDPRALGRIARSYRDCSISLTTMGVGLDYNENLMTTLAERGGGNYYFIESSHSLASIFRREFDLLGCVVAQNVQIELRLGRGIRAMDVVGADCVQGDGRVLIGVGDLYAGERREFTIELEIPAGAGKATVATGELRFDPVRDEAARSTSFSASVTYTKDVAEIDSHRDWDVQAKADVALSTRRVERALSALDDGRQADAVKEIAAARAMLKDSPAAAQVAGAPVLMEQERKLQVYEQTIADSAGDVRKVKKSIQYDNYRTQRKK